MKFDPSGWFASPSIRRRAHADEIGNAHMIQYLGHGIANPGHRDADGARFHVPAVSTWPESGTACASQRRRAQICAPAGQRGVDVKSAAGAPVVETQIRERAKAVGYKVRRRGKEFELASEDGSASAVFETIEGVASYLDILEGKAPPVELRTPCGMPTGFALGRVVKNDNAAVLCEHADAIRALARRTVHDIIEIGRQLAEAKKMLGHGNFLPWVKQEFAWSEDTAERLIAVHALQSQIPHVAEFNLPLSGLYLLSRNSTPLEAVEAVVAKAQSGKPVSVAEIKSVIQKSAQRTEAKPNFEDDASDEDVADPAQIEENILHTLARTNEHVRIFKKHLKLSTLDREAESRITTAIEQTIEKWRSVQATLAKGSPPVGSWRGQIPQHAEFRPEESKEGGYDGPEDFWRRSLANAAGDAVALRAIWRRYGYEWERVDAPSDLISLAKQAAAEW
jgi:hypothetical protein